MTETRPVNRRLMFSSGSSVVTTQRSNYLLCTTRDIYRHSTQWSGPDPDPDNDSICRTDRVSMTVRVNHGPRTKGKRSLPSGGKRGTPWTFSFGTGVRAGATRVSVYCYSQYVLSTYGLGSSLDSQYPMTPPDFCSGTWLKVGLRRYHRRTSLPGLTPTNNFYLRRERPWWGFHCRLWESTVGRDETVSSHSLSSFTNRL